jgi:hypothetical protein
MHNWSMGMLDNAKEVARAVQEIHNPEKKAPIRKMTGANFKGEPLIHRERMSRRAITVNQKRG